MWANHMRGNGWLQYKRLQTPWSHLNCAYSNPAWSICNILLLIITDSDPSPPWLLLSLPNPRASLAVTGSSAQRLASRLALCAWEQ